MPAANPSRIAGATIAARRQQNSRRKNTNAVQHASAELCGSRLERSRTFPKIPYAPNCSVRSAWRAMPRVSPPPSASSLLLARASRSASAPARTAGCCANVTQRWRRRRARNEPSRRRRNGCSIISTSSKSSCVELERELTRTLLPQPARAHERPAGRISARLRSGLGPGRAYRQPFRCRLLRRFLLAYQGVDDAEACGEIWAVPLMLGCVLIENLRRLGGGRGRVADRQARCRRFRRRTSGAGQTVRAVGGRRVALAARAAI